MHPAHKLLKNATKDNGRILAIGPNDNLVELAPGSVSVGFDQATGAPVFKGVKDGFRLATPADVQRKEDEEAERKAKEAGEESAPAPAAE